MTLSNQLIADNCNLIKQIPVILVGVSEGVINIDGLGYQVYDNIGCAYAEFPEIRNELKFVEGFFWCDSIRIETVYAFDLYNNMSRDGEERILI